MIVQIQNDEEDKEFSLSQKKKYVQDLSFWAMPVQGFWVRLLMEICMPSECLVAQRIRQSLLLQIFGTW